MSPVDEVYRRVAECFVWQSDKDSHGVGEHWDHFADLVRAGEVAHRDCEDFALTCLIIGIEDYGWDRDKCRVARVATEMCSDLVSLDHAVAIYDGHVLDNRMRGPVPLDWPNYRWYDYCGVPLTEWRLYEGGKQFNERGHW